MIGPACLADAIDHGSELPPRIRKSLQLMRQLDLASRLVTKAADKVVEERDGKGDGEEEEEASGPSSRQRGGRGRGRGGASSSSNKKAQQQGTGVEGKGAKKKAADLKALQRAALSCADEKVGLAVHIYDLLDTQIRRVDIDLRRLERHYGFVPPVIAEQAAAMAAAAAAGGGGVGGAASGAGGRFGMSGTRGGPAGGRRTSGAVTVVTGRAKATLPSVDPNEPVYCFCRQVAFGEMVACDNPSCEHEWFHYGCVGLTRPPYGSWQCSQCKRRKSGSLGGGVGGAFKRPKPK